MPSERCFSRARSPALRRYVADDLVVVLDSAQPNGGVWFPAIVRHADAAKRTCDVLVYLAERTRAADPAGAADGALAPGADGKVVSRRVERAKKVEESRRARERLAALLNLEDN